MAFSQWWAFAANLVDFDHNSPAVYQFSDGKEVGYIGSTMELKRRLKEHLGENATPCIKRNATHYCYDYRSDFLTQERQLLLDFQRQYGRLPRCNTVIP